MGIARAKEKGVFKGGEKKINVEQIKTLKKEGRGGNCYCKASWMP
tara:strand:- start:239 stop:373 length:135 start_codon:yes stop_codon:yes gene_type:complete